ncbi:MAG: hypothetical protein ACQETD_07955, partial [Pseudomonadota bacterium]
MEPISFRIPEQHPPRSDDFDTRPAAVERWVAELPMGNIGEAARQLYQALQQLNRLRIPPGRRLEVLERLGGPLSLILESLRQRYSGSHFPLPAKVLRTAQFSSQLLSEVVIGYQAVLEGEEESSILFRLTHHKMWPLAVHRLIYYLGQILLNARQIHRPYPAGVWLAVHRLFYEAERHGRTGVEVELPGAPQQRESLSEAYRRTLLLTLLEPQLFTRAQMEEIDRLMPVWLEYAALRSVDDESDGYCIRLDVDAPHVLGGDGCADGAQAVVFDLAPLVGLLERVLAAAGETLSVPGYSRTASRETLETLRQCWRVTGGERPERHASDIEVETAVGLSAIFTLMRREGEPQSQGVTDQTVDAELEPLLPVGQRRKPPEPKPAPVKVHHKTPVWESIFYATEVIRNSWALG